MALRPLAPDDLLLSIFLSLLSDQIHPKANLAQASFEVEQRKLRSFQMAYALLSQITEEIKTLFLSTSPPSSSFDQPPSDQPSHALKLREDLEALQRMVRRIQAVLADAERREIIDESVKLWLRELSCLAYDADDVLDDYNYVLLRAQVEAGIQSDGASRPPCNLKHHQEVSILTMASSSSSDGSTLNKMADRMRKIRVRFEEISHQREALHLREGAVRERQNVAVRRPSSHLPDAPTIFGREKILEEVISMLLSLSDGGEKRTLSVLPIVGMGGVGKTTLVQHVYNDRRVCDHFSLRGWVCVSDDFAVDSVTRRIVESLTRKACQLNEFDAIQSELIQELKKKGKQFLVVLDDVWNETPSIWDSLLKPFRLAGVEGSAVIMTTRIESVARMVETMPFCHLDCLSSDTCWLMFKQHAFPGRDPADHMDLVQIGEKIVDKCKGLPLAVKVLGSLLRNEFDCDRWEEILQSEVWDVPDQHDEIIPALRLSYLHLPSSLKPCFLYASVFPKDYEFDKEQLVQLWMAQGFLQCEGRKQVEDIGNMYFDDLMQRSLFSPAGEFPGKTAVMHDLIHDLARHISEGEISSCTEKEEVDEGKFFAVGGSKVRHLYISRQEMNGMEWTLQSLCSDEPRVIRSLLVVVSLRWSDADDLELPSELVPNLESLRALDLSLICISQLPDSMGYLRHLRYLNLERNEGIRRLPETIGMLYNLQVLNLESCWYLRSLPESIGGLRNLRYLNLSFCESLESLPESIGGLCNLQCFQIEEYAHSYPRGMNRLTNLRSLVGFCVSGEVNRMELLKDMVHLRGRLEIRGLENVTNPEDAVTANLRKKEHIRLLCLNWGGSDGDNDDDGEKAYRVLENLRPPNGLQELVIQNYPGIRFPSWMGSDTSSFSRLTRVELSSGTRFTLLPPLGQLPSLKRLDIQDARDVERVGREFRGVGFPALEVLEFSEMPSWVTWDAAERGDFPRLRKLYVSFCPKLQSMVPLYLFPALQELHIGFCDSLSSVELKMPPPSSSPSSIGPPPLVKMTILECRLARFSPEDEPLLLPATLQDFSIGGCPLLLEWCRREDGRRRLAHIPRVDMPELEIVDSDSCSD